MIMYLWELHTLKRHWCINLYALFVGWLFSTLDGLGHCSCICSCLYKVSLIIYTSQRYCSPDTVYMENFWVQKAFTVSTVNGHLWKKFAIAAHSPCDTAVCVMFTECALCKIGHVIGCKRGTYSLLYCQKTISLIDIRFFCWLIMIKRNHDIKEYRLIVKGSQENI